MTRTRIALATIALTVFGADAHAMDNEDARPALHTHRDVVIDVDATEANIVDVNTFALAGSKILYVNRCEGGETIVRGFNDSRQNRSSIINQTTTFPAYPYGDASWNQVMMEVRDILAPFGIDVTDRDPGNVPHFEIIACGTSWLGPSTLGVAPSACGVIENAIGFAFAEGHGNDPRGLAETIVHEAAHTWSMDHLYDCADPMTYLGGCGDKYFQDEQLQCAGVDNGRWVTQTCKCGGATMNSFQTILGAFGPADPTPPLIEILEPVNGAQVEPGFVVRPEVTDDNGLDSVALYVDGTLILSLTTPPFVFNGPTELAHGPHTVEIRAKDRLGTVATSQVTVVYGTPCDCAAGEVCIDNLCIAGPGTTGGLGESCTGDTDCATGMCATAGDTSVCTATCSTSCGSGFDCVAAGSQSVCWPAPGGGGGNDAEGGCRVGEDTGGAASLLLALGALLMVRRRRNG